VLAAGGTVCIALLGILVLGISFLSGLAVASALTAVFTVIAAVTLLPALLGVFGTRVLRTTTSGNTPCSQPSPTTAPPPTGQATRCATCAQRRLFMGAYVRMSVLAVNADLPFMCVFECLQMTCAGMAACSRMTSPVCAFHVGLRRGATGCQLERSSSSAKPVGQAGAGLLSDRWRLCWRVPVTSASPVAGWGVGRQPPRAGTRRRGGGAPGNEGSGRLW
jgi:hypothetical protein